MFSPTKKTAFVAFVAVFCHNICNMMAITKFIFFHVSLNKNNIYVYIYVIKNV